MAIATGTMTVTITESLDVGTTVMDTATSIAKTVTVNDIYKRVITVSTNEVTLYDTHDSNVGGSTFDDDLICTVVYYFDFDEIPDPARRYILIIAAYNSVVKFVYIR